MTEPSVIRQRVRHVSAGWSLLLLTMALLAPLDKTQSEGVSQQSGSAISRLVRIVAESGENEQQDFTWIALSELIAAYEKVYLNSSSEAPKEQKGRAKLISWRNGTRRYIAELHGLLDLLPGTVELQIQTGEAGPPVIYIDGKPVVISGPEIGSVMFMEKRIIDTYCAMYDCSELTSAAELRSSAVMVAGRGVWNLRNFGKASYETPDGLIFTFSGISGRTGKQQTSEALAAEMRSLAAGLRDAMDAGHPIDWNRLEIQPLPGSRGHRILFNNAGEYLRLALPGLAQFGAPSPAIIDWIKQRTFDETPAEVEIFADGIRQMRSGLELE